MRRISAIKLATALKSPKNEKAISIIETMGPREGKGRHRDICIAVRKLDGNLSCFCLALAEELINLEEIIRIFEEPDTEESSLEHEPIEPARIIADSEFAHEETEQEAEEPNSHLNSVKVAYEATIAASNSLKEALVALGYTFLLSAHRNEVIKLAEKLILEPERTTPKTPDKQFIYLTSESAKTIRVAYVGSEKSKGQVRAKLRAQGINLIDIGSPTTLVDYVDIIVINYSKEMPPSEGEKYIKAYSRKFCVQISEASIEAIAKKIIKTMKTYLREKVRTYR